MSQFVIPEIREYVFGLWRGICSDNGIDDQSLKYLGTGFFVTKRGDALTAAHVIPTPDQLQDNEKLICARVCNGVVELWPVSMAAIYQGSDLAVFRVALPSTKYFPCKFDQVDVGTDVTALGIPEHEVYGQGKELRLLKGHVQLAVQHAGFCEISFAVPAGMSGGPVFEGREVIGFLSGNSRTEQVEDQFEDIIEERPGFLRKHTVETKSVIRYGRMRPLSLFSQEKSDVLEGRTLQELIDERNAV